MGHPSEKIGFVNHAPEWKINQYHNGMSLEVWRSFWADVRRAKEARSKWVYLVSALVKDLMTKNTSLNFASPHSLNKAALTAISEATR